MSFGPLSALTAGYDTWFLSFHRAYHCYLHTVSSCASTSTHFSHCEGTTLMRIQGGIYTAIPLTVSIHSQQELDVVR